MLSRSLRYSYFSSFTFFLWKRSFCKLKADPVLRGITLPSDTTTSARYSAYVNDFIVLVTSNDEFDEAVKDFRHEMLTGPI